MVIRVAVYHRCSQYFRISLLNHEDLAVTCALAAYLAMFSTINTQFFGRIHHNLIIEFYQFITDFRWKCHSVGMRNFSTKELTSPPHFLYLFYAEYMANGLCHMQIFFARPGRVFFRLQICFRAIITRLYIKVHKLFQRSLGISRMLSILQWKNGRGLLKILSSIGITVSERANLSPFTEYRAYTMWINASVNNCIWSYINLLNGPAAKVQYIGKVVFMTTLWQFL